MKIDCRNLECPKPVIETKKALEALKIGDELEILVNDIAPLENIKRFLTTNGLEYEIENHGSENLIKTIKTKTLTLSNVDEFVCVAPQKRQKVVYLNDEKAGSGEVGVSLMSKFLSSIASLDIKPKMIICANTAVLMTTNRAHSSFSALKNLEDLGVEILSCGSCLEAYKVVDKLSIGRITNAFEIVEILSNNEIINL